MANPRIPFQLSDERPALEPMGGKPLMAHMVINVEHWEFDGPMPRAALPAPYGLQSIPDVPNFSWVDYGMRCGLPRIVSALKSRGLPASVSINANALDAYPRAAEILRDAGWEFVGHGVQQRSMQAVDDERAVIAESLDRLDAFTGTRPRGWLGPGLNETFATPDLLIEHGVDYVLDWVVDDLPTWMSTAHGPLIAMPYSLELNDSVVFAVERQPATELERRVIDTLTTFEAEAAHQPRVLTLPLHPHLIGVPHRAPYLERILDILTARDDTAFVTGSAIADWYRGADATPGTASHAR